MILAALAAFALFWTPSTPAPEAAPKAVSGPTPVSIERPAPPTAAPRSGPAPGGRTQAAPAPAAFASDRITVEVRGRGPDVILIPGLASTGQVWRGAAQRLDDDYRLHIVTVRGFGSLEAGANGAGGLSAPVSAEIRRYIAQQGLNRPAVIGHSLGGLIALRVAADAGPAVGRVMVVDASPFFPALLSEGATVGDVKPLAQIAYQAILFLGDQALSGQSAMMGRELGGAAGSLFGNLGWQGGDRHALAQGLYEVMTTDLRNRLPDITAPVAVVYGWSPDDASPRARVDALFRASFRNLPRPPVFERVEGAEHMVMIDQPARFEAAVRRFLS